ncbi:hypothetical protein LguiA_012683 [Lonicera macranthoides]
MSDSPKSMASSKLFITSILPSMAIPPLIGLGSSNWGFSDSMLLWLNSGVNLRGINSLKFPLSPDLAHSFIFQQFCRSILEGGTRATKAIRYGNNQMGNSNIYNFLRGRFLKLRMDNSQKFTEDSALPKCSEQPDLNNLLTLQADSTNEECDLALGRNTKVVEGIEMKTWPKMGSHLDLG